MHYKYFHATQYTYETLASNPTNLPFYPLLRDDDGEEKLISVSPDHGRSFCIGMTKEGRFIISKGNGLCYSEHAFLNTGEMRDGTWGLLLERDAIRDYNNGMLAAEYGILTNRMHGVIKLNNSIIVNQKEQISLSPVLLQYDIACPYRLSDAVFMSKSQIEQETKKWESTFGTSPHGLYAVAAKVLIKNLRVLHDNKYLHNALSTHNYTWALELLDFEMSNSIIYPYSEDIDENIVKELYNREVLYTYQIIVFIAGVLKENVNFGYIDGLFEEYGFSLNKFEVTWIK